MFPTTSRNPTNICASTENEIEEWLVLMYELQAKKEPQKENGKMVMISPSDGNPIQLLVVGESNWEKYRKILNLLYLY